MNETFYKDGLCFSCQRCSSCCRFDPGFVNLSEQDLEKLQKWATMDRENCISSWCRWVSKGDGFEYLCLKEKSNFDCILWDNGCMAYELRPLQCSSYPFWSSLLSDIDWWEANGRDCPGINKGKRHELAEIEGHLTARKSQPYIRRKAK
jgi:Fe-S-cluster containining protein